MTSEEPPSSINILFTMSATTAHRPQRISFQSPSDSLRQGALKKNMSITQTYYLAHKARGKLSREAAQPDHDLRLLVGHANLLDNLMLELADAEREQERWFNQSVRGANSTPQKQDRRVQWAENIAEVHEEESSSEDEVYDSDSSDDDYEEDDLVMTSALRPAPGKASVSVPAITVQTREVHPEDDEDEVMHDDLEEDYAQLELVRTPSHSNSPPPELVDESDSSDDDSSMPPSPPEAILTISGKGAKASPSTAAAQDEESPLYDEDYYLPRRSTPLGSVSAISVY
jgi:hypothetical protein